MKKKRRTADMKGQCIEKRRQQQPERKIRRKDGKREQDTENKKEG